MCYPDVEQLLSRSLSLYHLSSLQAQGSAWSKQDELLHLMTIDLHKLHTLFSNTVAMYTPLVIIPWCFICLWYLSQHSVDGRAIASPISAQLVPCLLISLRAISNIASWGKHIHTSSSVHHLLQSMVHSSLVGVWSAVCGHTQNGHASLGGCMLKVS